MCEEFENKKKKEQHFFDLPEQGFEPQIFSNFPVHDWIFMESEEPEIKSKQASKRDRTILKQKWIMLRRLVWFFWYILEENQIWVNVPSLCLGLGAWNDKQTLPNLCGTIFETIEKKHSYFKFNCNMSKAKWYNRQLFFQGYREWVRLFGDFVTCFYYLDIV